MSQELAASYTIGPEIGKGSFATVYKCTNNKTHQAVAIKSVERSKLRSKKLLENLEIEISILKSTKHPHIVALLDYNRTSTHFHLVMDYCSMGDLSYFIRKRDQLVKTHPVISPLLQRYPSPEGSNGLNPTLVIHFLQQLSSALEFLRSKSLVHRDIKPQNLLLCPPVHSRSQFEQDGYKGLWELPILKIADFGFARFLPSTSLAATLCGSPLYMAPEILRGESYNAKADLWSVGAVLYEMSAGKPPFRASNHIELEKVITRNNDRIKFPASAQVPEPLKSLIKSLLKNKQTERISFNEFFSNPLIVNELESNDEPLETSEMDENLFISEYISPIKSSDRVKFTQTNVPIPLSQSDSRDEQIKLIITRNSPDPSVSTQSIQLKYSDKQLHSYVKNREDVILERDYVMVEKRAVEVNAIADELARMGTEPLASGDFREEALQRRNSQRSGSSESQRRPSFGDRRISISISPTNALGKAISLASNRLFGASPAADAIQEEVDVVSTGGKGNLADNFSNPDFANNLLLHKLNLPTSSTVAANMHNLGDHATEPLSDDEKMLEELEFFATKAHAINLFADVKFSQLIPSPPSEEGGDDDYLQRVDLLPPKMVKTICEEGVVLYVKTLSLLAKGMRVASDWWILHHDTDEQTGEQRLSKSLNLQIRIKINELVQWIREKFNECLEKGEYIKLRLEEAQLSISKEETVKASSYADAQGTVVSNSSDPDGSSRIIAEKLIFDRALEISRTAAVNELVKEDLKGCELAYSTAIWMLEALLDEDVTDAKSEATRLDGSDRETVEKFILSIGNRLSVLKRKLDLL
ncbi:CIC11C00000004579 [Sungouiella intermedia]|uniref:Serine/threonine-protein kinase ATG1 n=1 Tax=Sungouiella intermedia TaxID=45354 RepID=A0A1L0BN21_9ASCO|nr:CIC11C00000004579 [[Candida] intermedia]